MRAIRCRHAVYVAAALAALPSLAWGAGFALFEHGNRAMAMAGAFTAVADDPSALFWNPAGVAFQKEKGVQVMAGFTLIGADQKFTGMSPYPGDGYTTEQKSQWFYPPHFYLVYPLNDRVTATFSMNTPFGLGTWWDDDYAGRFLTKRVDLRRIDLTPGVAVKLNDWIAVGMGFDYAVGQIDLTRSIGVMNPYTQQIADVGQVHLYTDGLGNSGYGWNASVHARAGKGFTFGALYRSGIKIDFDGYGSFTQYSTGYPDFDAIVATQLPFSENAKLKTSIDFPDYWSVGVAWASDKVTVSGQYGRMGWSSFQRLPITFVDYPYLSGATEELYTNAAQYRLGFEYRHCETWAFQAGVLYDETPQPRESMSPLLGDANRTGYSLGLSWIHGKMRTDVGYMYLPFDKRGTGGHQLEGYDGSYETTAHLFGASLTLNF